MAVKVYSPPAGVAPPDWDDYLVDGRFDYDRMSELDNAFRKRLADELRASGYTGKRTGTIWRYPVADGYAEYMVAERNRSIVLIHLPLHDAYSADALVLRGLRAVDIREYVDSPSIFGNGRDRY